MSSRIPSDFSSSTSILHVHIQLERVYHHTQENPNMSRRLLWACYATCFFQPHHSRAQETVQQILWNVPDGNLTDLSQTFTAGTTLPLSWNGWTSPDYIDAFKTLVDLWVTAWDYNLNPFSQLLKGKDRPTRECTASLLL
jgi:hypothetical protein